MKITTKQLRDIIKEEVKKTAKLNEGMMKQIYTEFQGFVESYDLQPEDILGMMDMLWPQQESEPEFQNAGEQSTDDRAMQSGDWYGDRDK